MTVALTPPQLADVRDVLAESSGVTLTDAAVAELVGDELAAEVLHWGGGDTETSTALVNALSQALLGRPWPTFGDALTPAESDAFYAALGVAAAARGWVAAAPSA